MMVISPWIVAFVCFLLFFIFLYKKIYDIASNSKSRKKLPPTLPRFPVIGNLHQLGLYPHRSLQSLSKRYGPLMLLHLGSVPVLVVSSADAARKVMKDNDLNFSNRPKSRNAERLFYGCKDVAFAPYGQFWRQVRSISVLHLLSNKRVQSFRRIREEETSRMVKKIRQLCSSSSSINVSDIFVSLANDIVCRAALGRKYGAEEGGKKFKSLLSDFVGLLGTFCVGDYIPWLAWISKFNGFNAKVERVTKVLDEFLEGVVEEHCNRIRKIENRKHDGINTDETGPDLVDILLDIQSKNGAGFQLETDAIKALILDVFAAGTETTYSVLEWIMAELLRNPAILEKLQNEVRQIAGKKSEITEDDLEKNKMQYLRAVIKESLRLHAPVPLLIPRESTQFVELMGYDIEAGTQVIVNAWAIGRDPSLWENPEEFRPERFFETDIDFKGLNLELIPFGTGRRGCPGVTFATAVIELALAKLVHKFNFALPNGEKESDMDMTEATGIVIHKKFPMHVVASPYSC